jgi:tRNA(Arg) A34 adenosine deaminase TadA
MPSETTYSMDLMAQAIRLACENVERGGRPYGAVIARDAQVVAIGVNRLIETNDPTEHAELNAIRAATRSLASPTLGGCIAYASGQPCPMCLAALRIAKVDAIYYAYSNEESAPFGFTTAPLYDELVKPVSGIAMPIVHRGKDAFSGNPFELYAARTRAD